MRNNIALVRKEMGYTQQEIADRLGISKAAVAQYESGKTESIRPDRLLQLSQILQASPAYLMGWSNLRQEPTPEEMELIRGCQGLNPLGMEQLRLRLWELSQIWYYTHNIIEDEEELAPVAAHADKADVAVLKGEIERIRRLIDKGKG